MSDDLRFGIIGEAIRELRMKIAPDCKTCGNAYEGGRSEFPGCDPCQRLQSQYGRSHWRPKADEAQANEQPTDD